MISVDERKFILDLAKRAIENFLETGEELKTEEDVPDKLKKERACFVTLTKNGQLRGCIGNITPVGPLHKSVISNAIGAAFYDGRFEPVEKSELKDLDIEISVLDQPRTVRCGAKKGEGVILEKDGKRAVFLPQVWEELPDREDFMRHLALKAGLGADEWQEAECEVFGVEVVTSL